METLGIYEITSIPLDRRICTDKVQVQSISQYLNYRQHVFTVFTDFRQTFGTLNYNTFYSKPEQNLEENYRSKRCVYA